jgi:SHS2 domain-containing protein
VPHTYLPHTADLRAGVSGSDLASLYQSAADLVREVLVGGSAVAAGEERRLVVEGADEAERFFRFVRELLYLYDCEGFLPVRVALTAGHAGCPGDSGSGGDGGSSEDGGAGGSGMSSGDGGVAVLGERFDAARHASERQVKALTRHGYRFERTPAGYQAELLFDL